MKKVLRSAVLLFVLLLHSPLPGRAQGSSDIETNFVAMLKNATLKGTWAPVQQEQLGAS